MNKDARLSFGIEELEQRLEMSAVPILPTDDGEENIKRCSTSTIIDW